MDTYQPFWDIKGNGGLRMERITLNEPISNISVSNIVQESGENDITYYGIQLLTGTSLTAKEITIDNISTNAVDGSAYGLQTLSSDLVYGTLNIANVKAGYTAAGLAAQNSSFNGLDESESKIRIENIEAGIAAVGAQFSDSGEYTGKELVVKNISATDNFTLPGFPDLGPFAHGVEVEADTSISSISIEDVRSTYGTGYGLSVSSKATLDNKMLNINDIEGISSFGLKFSPDYAADGKDKHPIATGKVFITKIGGDSAENTSSNESVGADVQSRIWSGNTVDINGVFASNNGIAAGIKNYAAEARTESGKKQSLIQQSSVVIRNVTGGEAYGLMNTSTREYNVTPSVTFDSQKLTVSDIVGKELAFGIYNSVDAQLDIDSLTVNNVKAEFAVALDAEDKSQVNIGSADINPANWTEYNGGYTDDNQVGSTRQLNTFAVRSVSGANVIIDGLSINIFGTIVAGRGVDNADVEGGSITIGNSNSIVNIRGDVYAGNGGEVSLTLGKGSILEGQIDDYHELGTILTGKDTVFRNSAFVTTDGTELPVTAAGSANLTLNGGTWIARGQSFVDTVTLSNGGLIDLSKNENSSVTIDNLSGNGIFKMHLNTADRSQSDMLYVTGSFSGQYELIIEGDDFDANEISSDNPLRFATVKGQVTDSAVTARSVGGGFFNNQHEILVETFAEGTEDNEIYNGTTETVDYKPGNDYIENAFEDEDTNLLIGAAVKQEQSNVGRTVIALSKANYANAVYMDTLNKRLGEARYTMGKDDGVWVRLRHDNIGKEDAFRSHNTMVELGYDLKDVNAYGEFHTGVAIDYLNGSIDYHNVNGDGDLQRYGLWFYTTFLGNDGQYADLVLKYGHLKNDFDVTSELGEMISGDYSNDVVSLSAETGWKFTHDTGFYIEPQVQLQYSYVTSADYTTSQHTQVELDSIHSLIGRAGFRAGKDFAAKNPITAYIRGDVLHEFLGDQDIRAYDNTGVFDATYENDDTWYSVGVGLSVMTSENTYFYIEGESRYSEPITTTRIRCQADSSTAFNCF